MPKEEVAKYNVAYFDLIHHSRFNTLSAVYANWRQHTPHTKAWFTPIGINIQADTSLASTFETERGKFDNVCCTPLLVAISKK